MSRETIDAAFPSLAAEGYEVTSPATHAYNCIAFAAGDDQRWWWPDPTDVAYWPPGVPRQESIAAFLEAFRSLGYELCPDASVANEGFDMIALYAKGETPTHAEAFANHFENEGDLFGRYFPIGCHERDQTIWLVDVDSGKVATIHHETHPDDYPDEEWVTPAEWMRRENLP